MADRVRFKGNDQIWAGGKVTVDRSDFAARSDSMRLDTGAGSDGTLIGGEPILRGIGADSFRLTGKQIDLALQQRELSKVVAKGQGHAVNRDWDLTADTIAIDLKNRKIDRTLAWGATTRPYAVSTSYAMRADSLALDSPGQLLSEVRGYRKAWLGGAVDSATKDRDWMKGDTVIAHFTPSDSAGKKRAVLSQIEARAAAQSYHLDKNAKSPGRPSINYARGDAIVVTMKNTPNGGVDRVDIHGKVDGIQLEAAADTAASTGRLHSRSEAAAMTAPEWISALGDRDPSVGVALAAITRAAGPGDVCAFADLVMTYREAHLACYQGLAERTAGDHGRRGAGPPAQLGPASTGGRRLAARHVAGPTGSRSRRGWPGGARAVRNGASSSTARCSAPRGAPHSAAGPRRRSAPRPASSRAAGWSRASRTAGSSTR